MRAAKFFELADRASKARSRSQIYCHHLASAFAAEQKFDEGSQPSARSTDCHRRSAKRSDTEKSAPLDDELVEWMKRERAKLSRNNDLAKAMD
jgi:hypothetical protein